MVRVYKRMILALSYQVSNGVSSETRWYDSDMEKPQKFETSDTPKTEAWEPVPIESGKTVSLSSIELHPEFQKAAKGFAELVSDIEKKETGRILRPEEAFGRLMESEGVTNEDGDIRFALMEDGEELGAFNVLSGFWRFKI